MTWQFAAACHDSGETFTPDHNDATRMRALADQYCAGCPVAQACGMFADRTRAIGLWGGAFRYPASGSGSYQWQTLTPGAHKPTIGRRRPDTENRWAA